MIKTFKEFVNESYRNLSDSKFNDKYDKLFANYALNEIPFTLSDIEADKCKDIYGNRDVGIVYHGGKIDTKEQLIQLQNLRKGNNFYCEFKSATPNYSEAESFAFYVKSYDESTMLSQLRIAMENGSAGKYGGYVITLKPTPEQVIISTFGEGKKPSMSAETECILKGNIAVLEVKIFNTLTKETYLDDISQLKPIQLFNSFTKEWIKHHKLHRADTTFIKKILNKITTEKEANDFLLKYQTDIREYIFDYIDLDEFLSVAQFRKMINKIKIKKGIFVLEINDKDFNISNIKDMHSYVLDKMKNEYTDFYKSIENLPYKISISKGYLYIDENASQILRVIKLLNNQKINKNSKLLNEINNLINDFLEKNVLGKYLKDLTEDDIYMIDKFFSNIKNFHFLNLLSHEVIHKACLWCYNDMPNGFDADSDNYRIFNIYRDMIPTLLKTMAIMIK